ncbi:hypothetical protein DFP72DRAFT_1174562 [Ephemerocybe angulata]|uniref:Uncharacterized protein n=1 Tax=Ephemerocybe angulata TaxID=980116 RepID=A0A8H6HJ59_9AGAR|nr:hypothetical protein DFP72DRAFT_1174562 [Tulosesus angulatus]
MAPITTRERSTEFMNSPSPPSAPSAGELCNRVIRTPTAEAWALLSPILEPFQTTPSILPNPHSKTPSGISDPNPHGTHELRAPTASPPPKSHLQSTPWPPPPVADIAKTASRPTAPSRRFLKTDLAGKYPRAFTPAPHTYAKLRQVRMTVSTPDRAPTPPTPRAQPPHLLVKPPHLGPYLNAELSGSKLSKEGRSEPSSSSPALFTVCLAQARCSLLVLPSFFRETRT